MAGPMLMGYAYLLLGFISSTFLSKATAPRMLVVGGDTVDELCSNGVVSMSPATSTSL